MSRELRSLAGAIALALIAAAPLAAQPSGGPYGPIPQRYVVPKAAHIYYVAPDGRTEAAGSSLDAPTTLESAIARVVSGDAVILRGGVYRSGGLILSQGITMQPYADEQPILKGTRIAAEWEALRNGIWRTKWTTLFPAKPLGWWRREREGMITPLHRFNNDMVFVDGRLLRSAGWPGELDAGSFYIDYDTGHVYIGTDPKDRLVEITAFDVALLRTSRPAHGKANDRKGPVVRGLTFTQYAYRAIDIEGARPAATAEEEPTDDPIGPADPASYGKEVTGAVFEHVTISYCSRVAGYFRGDGLIIRHSLVTDTGTEGIYVIGSSDVLLERNIIRRNNVEQLTGYYPAAVKIFNQSRRVTVRDNLVVEQPYSNGVWYDVGTADAVFVNNWVEGALIGFFFEISRGALVAGNVFAGNETGIRILNSANARIYHNTLVNSPLVVERNERSAAGDHFGWHPRTGPDVDQRDGHAIAGNLMVSTPAFAGPLMRVVQPPALCARLPRPQAGLLDANVYVRQAVSPQPLITWSPAAGENCQRPMDTLEALQAEAPGFERNGRALVDYRGPLFRSPELRNFELVELPTGVRPFDGVPADIQKLLGRKEPSVPGAFPFSATRY
jgi:hypothetical protein